VLLDFADILIEDSSHISCIAEDESSFRVETASKDIFAVFNTPLYVFLTVLYLTQLEFYFKSGFSFEEVLLIISDLNDERDFKGILQILGEDEGKQMSQVHSIARRSYHIFS